MWVARGWFDRRIAEEEMVVVVVIVIGWTLNNKISKNNGVLTGVLIGVFDHVAAIVLEWMRPL